MGLKADVASEQRVLGMSMEEFRLWVAGLGEGQVRKHLKRLLGNGWGKPKSYSKKRIPAFICDAHWGEIEASWETDLPVDAMAVYVGLTIGLHLAGATGPQTNACCKFNRHGWEGILLRARVPKEA